MDDLKKKAQTNAFYAALIYVGLGTTLLFTWVGNTNEIVVLIYSGLALLTLPVTFISWAITYAEADRPILLILGVQIVFFLVFWLVAYRHLLKKYEQEERQLKKEQGE